MSTQNPVSEAIEIIGLKPLANACGVTYQAVRRWEKGNMPRTEWTGESNYSQIIETLTDGKVTRSRLLIRRRA